MVRQKRTHRQAAVAFDPPGARLEERSEVLRWLWDTSSEGIFILQGGRVKKSNNFLATQAGYDVDEVEGTYFASFFDSDSMPTIESVYGQISPLHAVTSVLKATLLCKNGDRLDVQLRAACCCFGGKPAVWVTLRGLGNQVSDNTWDADLDCFFVSEETPVSQPAGS